MNISLFDTVPGWVLAGASLDLDFEHGRYFQQGAGRNLDSLLTVSRASTGYADDSAGNWSLFDVNTPRRTDKGLLVEEARTNSIRNNSMQGAVNGSPGTLPTNWVVNATGLTRTIVGTGTQNGIDYIDIRLNGTTGNTFGLIEAEGSGAIVATYGGTWSASVWLAVVGGDLTNISSVAINLRANSGGLLSSTISPTSTLTRYSTTKTFGSSQSAMTGWQFDAVSLSYSSGVAVDITVRIGWPQAENNNINSTLASATIAAGGTTGAAGTAVYQVGGGTGTPATLNVTVSGGAITAINSVASAGNYTVFPPSPAALTYVSGAGSGVVGATVNLTPTDNSAQGFPTSPIRTTAAAATRAADVVTATTVPTFGSAYTIFGKGTPIRADTGGSSEVLLSVNDGSGNNRLQLARPGGSAQYRGVLTAASSNLWVPTVGTWSQNTSGKLILAFASADHAFDATGQSVQTDATAGTPAAFTTIGIGQEASASPFNGYVEHVAIMPTIRQPNAYEATAIS